MNIFDIHRQIMDSYQNYIESFVHIKNPDINQVVNQELEKGTLCPAPLVQFNPSFKKGESVEDLCNQGLLHPTLNEIFAGFHLYQHQVEAMKKGIENENFVVTSGTGSGKSLTFLGTIFNYLLKNSERKKGVQAILVYPMNALINSQEEEIAKYLSEKKRKDGKKFDDQITYAKYTGQEKDHEKLFVRENTPDIILTNYMMLELMMSRLKENNLRENIFENLQFLVFDELHTYRGRQGADVGMLIRRIKSKAQNDITCIGTSATMASGSSVIESRKKVAEVASIIFGSKFSPEQIIGEHLETIIGSEELTPPAKEAVINALQTSIDMNADKDALEQNPLALWMETCIALKKDSETNHLVRNKPLTLDEIISELAVFTGVARQTCQNQVEQLLLWSEKLNAALPERHPKYFPFKLHQFISQAASVYVSLDLATITLEGSIEDLENRALYPVVFSRVSGQEFICVQKDTVNNKLLAGDDFTDFGDEIIEPTTIPGYIILDPNVWSDDHKYLLPATWVNTKKTGEVNIKKKMAARMPHRIYFNESGNYVEKPMDGYALMGWFMPAPLLFDPTSGSIYDTRTKDRTKLTRLGSEGRSTSTSILSLATIESLNAHKVESEYQKLLSFTDNRQDAALQAGHFNDFYQVAQIRGAIYRALQKHQTLDYKNIADAVFEALELDQKVYAKEPGNSLRHRKDNNSALKVYLMYRILGDLERGWRVVLPNLEQCALLEIHYKCIDEVCQDNDKIKQVPLLGALGVEKRMEVVHQILDYFRKSYAIYGDSYFSDNMMEQNYRMIVNDLKDLWSFGEGEKIPVPRQMGYTNNFKKKTEYFASIGSRSRLAKYLKSIAQEHQISVDFSDKGYNKSLEGILNYLIDEWGWLGKVDKGNDSDGKPVYFYRLSIDAILWKLGNKQSLISDLVMNRAYQKADQEGVHLDTLQEVRVQQPNTFFQKLYQLNFSELKQIVAKEHTGQVPSEDRQAYEKAFGKGDISLLFCSPTMELGIDIAELNIVHMRNVPPNPANYVQRSGRAGRGGQAALVFTSCSSLSPHDRHYFKNNRDMVAGIVAAPKIDLINEELLLAHLNAFILSQTGIPELNDSIDQLLETEQPSMPLKEKIKDYLNISSEKRLNIRTGFQAVTRDFEERLKKQPWYHEQWVAHQINNFSINFDKALQRWRDLYQVVSKQIAKASQTIKNGTYMSSSKEMKEARNNQDQGVQQRKLLRVEKDDSGNITYSEFHPFRYLASAGFLPGYNFTRLPISVYIPTGKDKGEYISRPRFIALREFGPRNTIYYNGRKYMVHRLALPDLAKQITTMKAVRPTGEILTSAFANRNRSFFKNIDVSNNANAEPLSYLVPLSDSRSWKQENISCEEEERTSRGYDIATYFSLSTGNSDTIRYIEVKDRNNVPMLKVSYMPVCDLIQVNKKWRAIKEEGFKLDLENGSWIKQRIEEGGKTKKTNQTKNESGKEEKQEKNVKIYTQNTANALYIEPIKELNLNEAGVVTLQYALKRAIEVYFEVEGSEISVALMGEGKNPNIFLYESSEGSLGILSQFVEHQNTFRKVMEKAYEVCRYEATIDGKEDKRRATYDDLLSYYNQRDHQKIDRFAIKEALSSLMECQVALQTNYLFNDYDSRYKSLQQQRDQSSSTEYKFLKHLYDNGLRLPDKAQPEVEGIYVRPDFYYEDNIFVFCDGTPHDDPVVQAEDKKKRDALKDRGYQVLVYYCKDDLAKWVAQHSHIFKQVREVANLDATIANND